MAKINSKYLLLPNSYLFAEIARKVKAYQEANPNADIIRMGIGDVTRPLTPSIVKAMEKAAEEMEHAETFRGYGPEQGYDFLINAVINGEYKSRNIDIAPDEIFISDGSKCDVANIQEIFDINSTVAIADPVYPVYLDSNVMAGRSGKLNDKGYFEKIIYMPSTKENNFKPEFPAQHADLIYICSPNNPTGTALTKEDLKYSMKKISQESLLGCKNLVRPRSEHEKFEANLHEVLDSLFEFLSAKNKNYGNSALEPIGLFSKGDAEDGILRRMDDKLNRIKNSDVLRKNDIVDLMGYLAILCINKKRTKFNELID